jgi:hypothetical protein
MYNYAAHQGSARARDLVCDRGKVFSLRLVVTVTPGTVGASLRDNLNAVHRETLPLVSLCMDSPDHQVQHW